MLVVLQVGAEGQSAQLWVVFLALKQALQVLPQDVEAPPVLVEPHLVWVVLALRLALLQSPQLLNRLQPLLLTLLCLALLTRALIQWCPISQPPPSCGLHCSYLWLQKWGP